MSAPARIGIYVHHQGGGHAARAGAIGTALRGRGAEVTLLSSLPEEALGGRDEVRGRGQGDPSLTSCGEVRSGSRWSLLTLPLDTDLGIDCGEMPDELHFAPLRSRGLAGRMARISRWIDAWTPDLLLVDVSVEVALLARLCGTPFVYLRQSGAREDPAHRLVYSWAAGLLAPYPERHEPDSTPRWMRAKTAHVGAVTRFDGLRRPPAGGRPRRVIVLGAGGGTGGSDLAATIAAAARGWEVLGPRPVDLATLARCAVVVAPAGANVVAEAAFANCGLVCLPQERPFGEQVARGELLDREAAAVVLAGSPAPEHWPALLEVARERRAALARWADGAGAGRAADYLLGLAGSSRSAASSHSTSPSAESSPSQPLAGHSPQRSR